MEELWLSREELIQVTGWSPCTLQRKVRQGELRSRDRKRRHPNGKPVREYSTATLSPAQQTKAERFLTQRLRMRTGLIPSEAAESLQFKLYPTEPSKIKPIRIPVNDLKVKAQSRFDAIAELAELPDLPDSRRFPRQMSDGTLVQTWTEAVQWAAKRSGSCPKTIARRYDAYKRGGLVALCRKERKDKGSAGFFSRYPRAKYLAAYLYLEEKMSVRVAHEAISRDLESLQISREDAPSYETVRSFLKSLPPALAVYAREGSKIYRERMAPYLTRHYTDAYANQIWVGDHMIHDVECANDCFENAEWGAPIRIRLSAMLDYRSRRVVGASWAWEGSSRAIAATVRRGISQNGPPEHIYVDNGKDYKKAARGATPGYLQESPAAPSQWWRGELDGIQHSGFMARLGIAVTHCIPHHPQSKHCERFFRTLHERFDRVWPTYTGGSPSTRPEATSLAMMDHRRLLRAGRVDESKHPLASRFIVACLAWIDEYNSTPHNGRGMDGASPNEIFESCRNPNQKPTPEPAILALLLAEHETRKVRECAVTISNRRYQPVDQAGWMILHEHNEREIIVARDLNDWECAAALDMDGNFLAWLRVEELARFSPGDQQTQRQIADSFSTRRGLEKATRETLSTISRVARANGAQSPLEAMAGRLRLPADTSGIVTQRKPRVAPDEATIEVPCTPAEAARMFWKRKSRLAPNYATPQNLDPGVATDRLKARLARAKAARESSVADKHAIDDVPGLEACG